MVQGDMVHQEIRLVQADHPVQGATMFDHRVCDAVVPYRIDKL